MNRELVFRLALLLTVLGLATQAQPDPNAFSIRDFVATGVSWTVQTVQDPNVRLLIAVLVLGIAVAAVVPRRSATRRRSRSRRRTGRNPWI